jgi:hypothetical protein
MRTTVTGSRDLAGTWFGLEPGDAPEVTGTGAPEVLQVRFERYQLDGLFEQLRGQRRSITRSAGVAHGREEDGDRASARDADSHHADLIGITRVIDRLEDELEANGQNANNAERVSIEGPTWCLLPAVRGATATAAANLADAVQSYQGKDAFCSAATVAAAATTASAWARTLVWCDHVDNHGLQEL